MPTHGLEQQSHTITAGLLRKEQSHSTHCLSGPVAQRGGEGLPEDVLEVIGVVGPHPAGVERHPGGVGEQVAVGLGAPEEGRETGQVGRVLARGHPGRRWAPEGDRGGEGGARNAPNS